MIDANQLSVCLLRLPAHLAQCPALCRRRHSVELDRGKTNRNCPLCFQNPAGCTSTTEPLSKLPCGRITELLPKRGCDSTASTSVPFACRRGA